MKKLLTLLSVLLVVALFTGCSFLPSSTPVQQKMATNPTLELFNYDGLKYHAEQVLVRTTSDFDLHAYMAKSGSKVLKEWDEIGWSVVNVPQGETVLSFIKTLRKEKGILLAEPNLEYHTDAIVPTVPEYGKQWGFKNMNAEEAWEITTGSENVIVAIIDTGVQIDHPEFEGKTIVAPFDATGETQSDVTDRDGHGTHVAGIAADDGRSGQIAGIAWDCPIMPIRVENKDLSIYTSYLMEGMIYVADYVKANPEYRIVVNMSIGGRGYNFAFKDAIDYAAEAGVLLVTSAGNDSKRIPNSYPSAYNGVVSVAASTPYDTKASFSTEGAFNSVAAPGVLIWSTYTGGSYVNLQGTSMASPYVAGAAALLLSTNNQLTPLQVKNQLEQTARGNGFTEQLGYGIVDIKALLGELKPMQYGSATVNTNIFVTEETGWVGLGIITLFDADERMVAYGTTGENGGHVFSALKAGTYKVNLTYYDMFADAYTVMEKSVTIVAEGEEIVDFTVPVVSSVSRELLSTQVIDVPSTTEQDPRISITVELVEAGFYEFVTSPIDGIYCDSVIYLYDGQGNLLAENDDFDNPPFSYIGMSLEPGTYTVVVEDFELDNDLYCNFETYSVTVTY